jgi:NDP-sugar pyrophosphorylase family protein
MTVLIPMAGRGERFVRENYTLPKPILPVEGLPMVIRASKDLPAADNYVYVLLEDHTAKYDIQSIIKEHIPQSEFVILDKVTEGQACTCLVALDKIADGDDIMIGACDNGLIYDIDKFLELKKTADVIVFTFRNNVTVVPKPTQYGWVAVEGENVKYVSVKVPISTDPIHDHAVVGAFWFKNKDVYQKSVEKMIAENRRINNEFYIDECINDAVQLGYNVKFFEVDKYICWGTPNDYRTFNYWKEFFKTF